MQEPKVLDEEELRGLLIYIQEQYNYDFTKYAPASLKRRLERILDLFDISCVAALKEKLEADKFFFSRFLMEITVGVTEMFRDPEVWKQMRTYVLPALEKLPEIRIWHPGCSTGEEVYTMAILLHEAGLLHKATLYASDINPDALELTRKGIYNHRKIEIYQRNYVAFEGWEAFSNYFDKISGNYQVKSFLKEKVEIFQHNLVSEKSPGQFDLIICRNVLIYFDQDLQNEVLKEFYENLQLKGFLVLGMYESLIWCSQMSKFKLLSENLNLMQKVKE